MTTIVEECTALALTALTEDIVRRFPDDPAGTLRAHLGMTVRAVDHLNDVRSDGGACDGISYLSDGVILYRQTGNRRENFTMAHELGHWLVDRVDEVYDRIAGLDDPAKMLETVCDRVARLLLLPDDKVSAVLGAAAVEAKHVAALYDATSASIPACAVALKDRLRTLGAVVVIDRFTESVTYASVRPDDQRGWPTVYPWPGHPLPAGHPLRSVRAGNTLRRLTYWQTPWGTRENFYIDAIGYSTRIVAVFSAADLWQAEQFHPRIDRSFDRRPTLEVRCCAQQHEFRGWPCPACGEGFCPTCGKCRCERQTSTEALCSGGCYMRFLPHLLLNGLCEDCR